MDKIGRNKLLSGSLILLIGSMVSNIGGYLYHLLMGRMLGPSDYGTLVSMISILYIFAIPSLTISTVVTKMASVSKAKEDYSKMNSVFQLFSRRFFFLELIIFGFVLLFCGQITDFLNVPQQRVVFIFLATTFLVKFLSPINMGLIQGLQKFSFISAFSVLTVVLKLGLGVFFVKIGFSIFGAVVGIVFSEFLVYFLSFFPLKFLFSKGRSVVKDEWRELSRYGFPAFIVILGLTSLYTTDIILVKHFFSAYEAGLYSALGMMGKIIFFASSSVVTAMFPLVAESHEKGESHKNLLFQSLMLVLIVSIVINLGYFVAPTFFLKALYGSSYLGASPILGFFGVFLSLYSVVNLLANYFLSIKKTIVAYFVFAASIAQVVMISVLHKSIMEVVSVSIFICSLLLISLLVFYFKYAKSQ